VVARVNAILDNIATTRFRYENMNAAYVTIGWGHGQPLHSKLVPLLVILLHGSGIVPMRL
jgi:hypothetical protein